VFNVIPFPKLRSDVEGIIYLNWVVDRQAVQSLVPEGVKLLDIGGKTIFSILTYRHGNFRPAIANWFRYLFPSPLQSNWRFYVESVGGQLIDKTVLFIKNIMDNLLFVVGTRISSDAMLTHYARKFALQIEENNMELSIDPEDGSSPDIDCQLERSANFDFPEVLVQYFGSETGLLEYLCLQHSALTESQDIDGICKADIDLPIDLTTVKALSVLNVKSNWLLEHQIVGQPFAFYVPKVEFRVLNETIIKTV